MIFVRLFYPKCTKCALTGGKLWIFCIGLEQLFALKVATRL